MQHEVNLCLINWSVSMEREELRKAKKKDSW